MNYYLSHCKRQVVYNFLASVLVPCCTLVQMQGAIQEAVTNSNPVVWLFDPAQIQFLNINIHRNNIVDDTIQQLLHHVVTDYKRPLKVGMEWMDILHALKNYLVPLQYETLLKTTWDIQNQCICVA